ncbi:MAG: choice-of-anchor J domain-containing protein [Bacteroidales bacterium]|nr:choice-of-anchor J domain-containing protein [Bacteroidales bacterium]MCF8334399.1 choice-of-anchor J domain-containing protein [Bacteroidales bacterium]
MRTLSTLFTAAFIMASILTFGQNKEVILEETFDNGLGEFTQYNVINDDLNWYWDEEFGDPAPCATMTGYDGQVDNETEDWLISSELDFTAYEQLRLTFIEAINYENDVAANEKVLVSTDYSGSGDPNEATWDEMEITNRTDGQSWNFIEPDPVDLSDYDGMSGVYIAFKYTSSSDNAATWEIDNIVVEEATAEELIVNTPNGGEHWQRGETYDITWTTNNFNNNVKIELTGSNAQVLEESIENTGSYSWDVPSDIALADDYRVKISDVDDGMPMDQSDTTLSIIDALYFGGFEEDLGDFMMYSVTGDQEWYQDAYMFRNYAKMSGYSGGAVENEDWLISPAFDMDAYENEVLTFESASKYEGPALDLMMSTDYDGSSDPTQQGTWNEITDEADWDLNIDNYNWTSSGEIDLTTVEGSSVYIAFVYHSNSNNASTWEVDNFMLQGNETNSIADNRFSSGISVYPNPSNGEFTVVSEALDNAEIAVYSVTGAKVYETQMDQGKQNINLSNLDKGVYTLRFITQDNKVGVKQVVIK